MNVETYIESFRTYMLVMELSNNSINTYCSSVKSFLYKHNNFKQPKDISREVILQYLSKIESPYTRKSALYSIKTFYSVIINQPEKLSGIECPHIPEYIPVILTPDEIFRIINSIKNLKHRTIIQIIYSCALRISESINIKLCDFIKTYNIQSGKNVYDLAIRSAKGNKDRQVSIPPETITAIRNYYLNEKSKPTEYLFVGQDGGKYSVRSIQNIFYSALVDTGIYQKYHSCGKKVSVHNLRHSRASHLLCNGADIKFIKDFLGHKKTSTTEIYSKTNTNAMRIIFSRADDFLKQQINQEQKYLHAKAS